MNNENGSTTIVLIDGNIMWMQIFLKIIIEFYIVTTSKFIESSILHA